jgi:RNA polymerase sigma factor (sigma-70 family)
MDPRPEPQTDPAAPAADPRPPILRIVRSSASDGPGGQPLPEELAAWIAAVAERSDRQAFGCLFAHFAPRVKSYLLRSGSEEAQADDLAQETLIALWRKAALFDPRQASAATWVFTIARNLRIDHFRRRAAAGGAPAGDDFDPDSLADDAPSPEEQVHGARMAVVLRQALARLPAEQAQVLRLSYYDDQPHARIAHQLGIPLGTVKSRMRLAVAHLRRLLDAGDPESSES